MSVDGQAQSDSAVSSWRSFLRSSIVWKLTLFVGVLVALNDGVLIGVAYITTSAILRDQIHQRLSTVAADRQGMLASALEQEEERATQFAKRSRIHQLLAERADGTMTPERFREETEPILSTARNNTSGFLALWIEDNTGQVLAASGPESLVKAYSGVRRSGERPTVGLVDPPRRVGGTYGALFSAEVVGGQGRVLGHGHAPGRFRTDRRAH